MKTEQPPKAEPATIRLADYTPPPYRIESVDLVFDLEPKATRVKATLKVASAHDRTKGIQPLALDGEKMKLLRIALDGKPLAAAAYELTDHGLTLPLPPSAFTLETEVEIDPDANKALEGLYVSRGVFCTQCEAEGFRRITFYPDRPDVMTVFRTTIRAPKASHPVLLSNGNPGERGDLPDGRHFAVWNDPHPKPSYLFALVAGDLAHISDSFTTMSGRKVDLRIYVEHGKQDRAGYAMDALKRSMRWDETAFGREYDLDIFNIVAVSDFNMGAMENKGLNIFNDRYILADTDTATDMDYYLIESIVAHEYFHNWSGDRVTCRDWFQLSLKEGLTVFRDQEFTADMRSRPNKRIDDVEVLRVTQFREDASPLAHPVRPESYIEINNFYTATVYQKGAEVIRMIQTILGLEKFRAGMDLYFKRHDGQAVTCEDFVAAMEDASGIDLTQFQRWYSQAGTPQIEVETAFDAAAKTFAVTVGQSCAPTPGQPVKEPYHIPIAVGLVGADGKDLNASLDGRAAATHVLELKQPRQTFVFKGVESAPRLSVNRNFAAPVTVKFAQSDADKGFLMAHDSDPFNRWNAAQDYGTAVILKAVADLQAGRAPQPDEAFITAMGIAIGENISPAFRASLLNLPAEDYLANRMATEDPLNLHAARKAVRKFIAARHQTALRALYDSLRVNAPYVPDAEGMGRRLLKRAALGYLAALETPETTALAKAQFDSADNMTDRMDALSILSTLNVPERQAALDAFYARFQNDHLVVNKWLTVQAAAPLPGMLTTVRQLMDHSAFDIKNPNKIRAVINTFAAMNPVNFHAADGSGYAFLADQILAINAFNPLTAARLVPPLGRWRRFDPARQALMKAQLERLAGHKDLSRDVYELVMKGLVA
ncbi:MAG: aminopeptidase N [Rhodospirillaceae bacterium]|nr:aminopeptidase N [Rhodospirillaceae bacterium]